MKLDDLAILDMLSFIYEDNDIDAIEEKFIELVYKTFSFDKVGLFYLKHKKGVLQGKLCRGFAKGVISSMEIPLSDQNLLTKPLITGFPVWNVDAEDDPYLSKLGIESFAVIPIVNKKRIPCWQIKACSEKSCPAYGKKWLRYWLVPNAKCQAAMAGQAVGSEKRKNGYGGFAPSAEQNAESVEGVLIVSSNSDNPVENDLIAMLATISYAVGVAINNSKLYSKTLKNAIKDELTGLYNRRYFNERLIDELERAKRYGEHVSVILADVDYFKKLNDTYGHPVGDRVLRWLGSLLQDTFRYNDVVARYGGEEFAILLLETDKNLAAKVAEGVRKFIQENSPPDNPDIKLTCSFGIASYGEDAYSMDGLISKADKALYCAKAQGRNKVCTC